jgi:hypothetical protein
MKKRFIVLVNSSTKQQEDDFIAFIKAEGFGYWHWLNNSWLLISHSSHHTAPFVREKVMKFFPNVNNMVLQFNEDGELHWNGFGPGSGEHNMFEWMHKNWTKR